MGFVFGTICLLALVRVAFGGFRHRHYAFHGGCGRGFPGGFRRHGGVSEESFARAAAEVFKRRLDITEEQDGIVDHALRDLKGALSELKEEFKATKGAVVEAFAGETVDDGALGAAFARHDDAIASARRAVVSALKQIHAVLSPKQREKATSWAKNAQGRWA